MFTRIIVYLVHLHLPARKHRTSPPRPLAVVRTSSSKGGFFLMALRHSRSRGVKNDAPFLCRRTLTSWLANRFATAQRLSCNLPQYADRNLRNTPAQIIWSSAKPFIDSLTRTMISYRSWHCVAVAIKRSPGESHKCSLRNQVYALLWYGIDGVESALRLRTGS